MLSENPLNGRYRCGWWKIFWWNEAIEYWFSLELVELSLLERCGLFSQITKTWKLILAVHFTYETKQLSLIHAATITRNQGHNLWTIKADFQHFVTKFRNYTQLVLNVGICSFQLIVALLKHGVTSFLLDDAIDVNKQLWSHYESEPIIDGWNCSVGVPV